MRNDKQTEEVLIEWLVETTIQILYDKSLIDKYDIANEVLKHHLLIEDNERDTPDFDPLGVRNTPWVYQIQQLIMSSNDFIHRDNLKIKQHQIWNFNKFFLCWLWMMWR